MGILHFLFTIGRNKTRCYYLTIVVLLAGCITADGDSQSRSAQRLRLEVTAESSLLRRGETLHIRHRVTNESDVQAVKHFVNEEVVKS